MSSSTATPTSTSTSRPRRCLYLWRHLPEDGDKFFSNISEEEKAEEERVLENVERLDLGGHSGASFARVSSGVLPPHTVQHGQELLAKVAAAAAPGATVEVAQAVTKAASAAAAPMLVTAERLSNDLRLAGLTDVAEAEEMEVEGRHREEIRSVQWRTGKQ